MNRNWRVGILLAMAGVALAACGPQDTAATPDPASPGGSPSQAAPNVAPVITGTPAWTVTAGTTYLFQANATDADGNTLTYAASGLPGWAAINAQTGMVYGTPAESDVGTTADIIVSVSDGEASVSLPAFRIVVASALPPASPPPAGNTAPTISGTPLTTTQATTAYQFTPSATDADSQSLTFSISNKPAWAAFNASTGRLSGTPAANQTGTYGNIVIRVSDGSLSASLPAFSITVTAAPNAAPTISGVPSTTVAAGANYTFTPTASDPNGDTLAFSITSKPSWATFSTATGRLSGTAQAGTYASIVISVSDGTTTRSLPAFTLTVSAANTGSAALSWSAPTQNTDGSALTDLAGYRVYHGLSVNALSDVIQVAGASSTSYTFSQLASGTHYFAVAAYTSTGTESALSAVGSKAIP